MGWVQVHAAAALRLSSTRQLLKAQMYQMGWAKVKVGFQKSDGLTKRTILKIPGYPCFKDASREAPGNRLLFSSILDLTCQKYM